MSFEMALLSSGLRPRHIVADGRVHRCPTESHPHKRNGWFSLHPDGHGVFGDWASGSGAPIGTYKDETAAARIDPLLEARMARRREQERNDRVAAMRRARLIWAKAAPLRQAHPYLANKGLSMLGCDGLRLAGGCLLVPVMLDHGLISLQSITGTGEKKFYPGAPVKAGAFVLARPRAAVTAICEGLATGLAVYQCVRQATVVVAFDCGNLLSVIQRIKPTGSVVIAADNDWRTQAARGFNPGLDKARNAAELIGCGVAFPEDIDGADWDDARRQFGDGAAKRIERLILAKAKYVMGASA